MITESSPAKKRLLRSDMELDMQCNILWLSGLSAVVVIGTGTMALESHMLATNALVILGIPIITLGVMKLVQPLGRASLNRSKRVEFVDDIKNPTEIKERLPAFGIFRTESSREFEMPRRMGSLLLMLVLYVAVVVLGFVYQSAVYFYLSVAISIGIVVFAIFSFMATTVSQKKKDSLGGSPKTEDRKQETHAIFEDSHISWVVNRNANTQIRFSRNWLVTQALFIGQWVPLGLAIPLIGPLFENFFWIAVGVGVVYLFVVEMCSLYSIGYLTSRVVYPR